MNPASYSLSNAAAGALPTAAWDDPGAQGREMARAFGRDSHILLPATSEGRLRPPRDPDRGMPPPPRESGRGISIDFLA